MNEDNDDGDGVFTANGCGSLNGTWRCNNNEQHLQSSPSRNRFKNQYDDDDEPSNQNNNKNLKNPRTMLGHNAFGSINGSAINNNIATNNTATTIKGKNHPSFTIILRRKLPIINPNLNEKQQPSIKNQSNNNRSSRSDPETVVHGNDHNLNHHHQQQPQLQQKKQQQQQQQQQIPSDFQFSGAWQIWLLNENDEMHNSGNKDHGSSGDGAWNIKCFGPPSNTARQFWENYQKLNEEIKGKELAKNIMIFRDSIEPKWEDKCNIGGGRWFFDLSHHNFNQIHQPQQQSSSSSLSSQRDFLIKYNSWTQCLQIVMSQCLGSLDDLIVGMILHFKSNKYRVSLWVRTQTNFNQVIELGKQLQKQLNLRCQIKFELHTGTTSNGSNNQAQVFNGLKIDSSAMDVICNADSSNKNVRKW